MDFGNLLSRSWQIVWNNKFMLVLGFLAALGSGGGGGGGGANSNFNIRQGDLSPGTVDQIAGFLSQFAPIIIGLICLLFIVAVILWLLRLTAQGALISSAARIDSGEKVNFGEAFSAGTGKLGRLVGINVLLYGPFTLLTLLAGGIFVSMVGTTIFNEMAGGGPGNIEAVVGSLGIIGVCIACLLCLLVPLMILVTAVYPFAQRGAVLGDMGVTASISHGWSILKANLGDVILLVFLFIVLGIVFGLLSFLVLIPFAILAMGPAIFGAITGDAIQVLDVLVIAAGGIFTGLVAAAINSIMVAFRSTAVTLMYREFLEKAE